MSLQLAVKYENAPLDLKALDEASTTNKKDAVDALDELKQRILLRSPWPRTFAGTPEDSSNTRDSIQSVQTLRSPASSLAVDSHVSKGDSQDAKTGLARYFAMKRRNDSVSSITSTKAPQPLTSDGANFHPALSHLLQGKTPEERTSVMKDIDEIIAAYQGLRVEGDRADAFAILTGSHDGPKRDTLAVLMGGDKRDTVGLHKEALQLLRDLPPTPGERQENFQYPAYNHNILNEDDGRRLSQWIEKRNDAPAPPVQSRWSTTSASSSVYSQRTVNSDPPSLYHCDSTSSRGSPISPTEPETPHPFFSTYRSNPVQATVPPGFYDNTHQARESLPSHIAAHLRTQGLPIAPPVPSQMNTRPVAPFSTPLRTLTPPNASFTVPPRPRTPVRDTPVWNPNSGLPTSSMRLPFAPGQDRSSIIPSPLAPARSSSGPNLAITTSTILGPTADQQKMMDGRPCKSNNYWGFCKGAWAVREDLKKGLGLETRPEGMYNTSQIWTCKHCSFSGASFSTPHPTKKNKKEVVVDPNIYVSAVGIRYRWIFLAKSHVKKRSPASSDPSGTKSVAAKKGAMDEGCNYGCVICSVEGNVTGIFGNVETLMNHVFMEHVRPGGMSESALARSKCVMGRMAGADEEWDINIPVENVLQV